MQLLDIKYIFKIFAHEISDTFYHLFVFKIGFQSVIGVNDHIYEEKLNLNNRIHNFPKFC